MIKTKKIIPILYTLGIILICSFINSILYYFNITDDKLNSIILYLIGMVAIFIGSYKLAINSNQKGIVSGLIFFIGTITIMLILSLFIFKVKISMQSFIYYVAILIFSVLGGIIGKNKKQDDSNLT